MNKKTTGLLSRIGAAVLLGILVVMPQVVHAQGGKTVTIEAVNQAIAQLDLLAQNQIKENAVPGLAIAVVFQDKLVWSKGYGVKDTKTNEPIDADTVFQIASVSKPIGSTLVAELVGEGKITWDSKLSDLDPGFEMYDPWVTREITIRDMYAHRSGLPEYAGDLLEDLGYARERILHQLRYQKPSGGFRSQYAYTNFGVTEAGVAAAKAYCLDWEDAIQKKLYAPLGMTVTSSRLQDFLGRTNKALGHVLVDGKWVQKYQRDPDTEAPAGGVSTSVNDLSKWIRLQLADGKFEGKQIVNAEALAETHTPQMLTGTSKVWGTPSFYGLGWNVGCDDSGRLRLSHSGAFALGTGTNVNLIPSEQLGIVVLSNASPTGVPEALTATFLDVATQGKTSVDWLGIYKQAFAQLFGALNSAGAPYAKSPASPTAALQNDAYVGTYTNDYFGDIQIVAKDGGLAIVEGPQKATFPLMHFDRDIFTYVTQGESAVGTTGVYFEMGANGKANGVRVENLDVNGNGTFRRVHLSEGIRSGLIAEIEKQSQDNNLPGVAVSINVPGEGAFEYAPGKANFDTGRVRELSDPFRIASITKTFTALATLILSDEGKLSLTDNLGKWYSDFPNADKITVNDLLRMRSGIPDAFDEELAKEYFDHPTLHMAADQLIARSAGMKSKFIEPDTETVYTNVNYSILERIIEKVSGKPINEQISESILKPLNLTNSLYATDTKLPGELHGYSWVPETKTYADKTILDPALAGGAGAMISTVSDLETYVRALCNGTLLKPATHTAQMQGTILKGNVEWVKYGEGIGLFGNFCGHTGTIFGFSTDAFYLPQLDATIIVNVNRLDLDDHSYSTPLQLALSKIVFPEYVSW